MTTKLFEIYATNNPTYQNQLLADREELLARINCCGRSVRWGCAPKHWNWDVGAARCVTLTTGDQAGLKASGQREGSLFPVQLVRKAYYIAGVLERAIEVGMSVTPTLVREALGLATAWTPGPDHDVILGVLVCYWGMLDRCADVVIPVFREMRTMKADPPVTPWDPKTDKFSSLAKGVQDALVHFAQWYTHDAPIRLLAPDNVYNYGGALQYEWVKSKHPGMWAEIARIGLVRPDWISGWASTPTDAYDRCLLRGPHVDPKVAEARFCKWAVAMGIAEARDERLCLTCGNDVCEGVIDGGGSGVECCVCRGAPRETQCPGCQELHVIF